MPAVWYNKTEYVKKRRLKMNSKKNLVREFIIITFGMMLVAAAVYFFMVPSKIVVGSISGLALVISQLTGIQLSILTFILNVVLLVIGFIFIGKEFGAKTVYTSMLLPVFLWIYERIVPVVHSVTGNPVYDLITYVLLVALGQALLFHVNASSGGLDIVAKIINKFTHMEIGKAVTAAGMVTAATSLLVYDFSTFVVSILGTYANGIAVDYFIDGFNKRKRVCILSDDYQEIQKYIMNELGRGVTLYEARGAYDGKTRTELITILAQQEYKLLLNYLHTTQKQVFVTVSTVNEVIGQWNSK